MKTVYTEKRVLQMVLEPSIWWEYELNFYLKSSLCQCSHRTRSGWLGLLSLLALWSHRGNGMRSQGSSALIPGSTSPILSPELEQEQGIPSEFCDILGWCWGSLTSCLPQWQKRQKNSGEQNRNIFRYQSPLRNVKQMVEDIWRKSHNVYPRITQTFSKK